MAWIEQTKKGSRKSGGPQYYLQGLTDANQTALGTFRRSKVHLWTPYGIVESGLEAVSSKVGSVGHDRVQSGGRVPSVADQIAHWFRLRLRDIERLEFDDAFDGRAFVIRPSYVKFVGRRARVSLYPPNHPLSLTRGTRSQLLTEHVRDSQVRPEIPWAREQICEIVQQHERTPRDLDERDLLRTSGALSKLGVGLGMYRRSGIDCPDASFELGGYPCYHCPIEIEERSSGFLASHHQQHRRQRVVLLCMFHDAAETLRNHVDVLELRELAKVLAEVA